MKMTRIERGCCDSHDVDCHAPACSGATGCCGLTRHFMTKEERREALEAYRDELKKELTGVEEHLREAGK